MYVSPQNDSFDLREYKKRLRSRFKKIRTDMSAEEKLSLDRKISERFLSSAVYRESPILLSYVSTEIEVDTREIISAAISGGKIVAAPKCVDGTRDMVFYIIKSLGDLESGAFGVLEPNPDKCDPLRRFDKAVCIVPALAYDMDGYRLGYGKGYYDRYLSAHKGLYSVGIEYCSCTVQRLERGKFDAAADMLITEKYIKTCFSAKK
ncbi:MAG: 5-formyltetrahydrofolate cyclo-ligase [Oscillospiraceae bacterium]|nr:5-formyltetrahydrofolate cyclo-ligase [Oscillospiraceae bacterium]